MCHSCGRHREVFEVLLQTFRRFTMYGILDQKEVVFSQRVLPQMLFLGLPRLWSKLVLNVLRAYTNRIIPGLKSNLQATAPQKSRNTYKTKRQHTTGSGVFYTVRNSTFSTVISREQDASRPSTRFYVEANAKLLKI